MSFNKNYPEDVRGVKSRNVEENYIIHRRYYKLFVVPIRKKSIETRRFSMKKYEKYLLRRIIEFFGGNLIESAVTFCSCRVLR